MNIDVMDLIKIVRDYFFGGRLNRKGYLIRLFVTLATLFFAGYFIDSYYNSFLMYNYGYYLGLVAIIAVTMIYFFSIAARRLHDIGLSGSYLSILVVLWFIILPIVGLNNPEYSREPIAGIVIGYAVVSILLIGLIFLILKKGQVKSNQYGTAS